MLKNKIYNKNASVNLYDNSVRKQAWEMELEEYRALKKRSKFGTFGAWCGIISLLVSGYTLWYVLNVM